MRGLQAYGMATWDCFRKPRQQGGLQLQTMVKLAEGVAGKDHGFRSAAFMELHPTRPLCAAPSHACRLPAHSSQANRRHPLRLAR